MTQERETLNIFVLKYLRAICIFTLKLVKLSKVSVPNVSDMASDMSCHSPNQSQKWALKNIQLD